MKKTSNLSLNEYLRKFKGVCDSLAAIGHPVNDQNKVFSLLTGLGACYEPFTTSMLKPLMPSYNEVVPLLQSYETRLSLHTPDSLQYTAFYTHKNDERSHHKNSKQSGQFSSMGRGFVPTYQSTNKQSGQVSSSTSSQHENHRDIMCQICGKRGHPAIWCWHRFNHSVQPNNLP